MLVNVPNFIALSKGLSLSFNNKRHRHRRGDDQPFPSFENSQHLAVCHRNVSSNTPPLANVKLPPYAAGKLLNTHPLVSPWKCGSSVCKTRRSFTSLDLVSIYETGGCHFVVDVCGHVTAASSSSHGGIQTRLPFCE